MSEKFDKIMYDKLHEYKETFLSQLLCGFHKVIPPIPTFTKTVKKGGLLTQGGFIGTILMDLSKTYDCLCHDLVMVKLDACSLDNVSPNLFLDYLIFKKQ